MASLAAFLRHRPDKPYVRPWALATPVIILLFCLPLLRPLRHPGLASSDEELRLATISALVETRGNSDDSLADRLAIDTDVFNPTGHVMRINGRIYSDQAPMLSFLLSGPYWVMHHMGYRLQEYSVLVPYLLTLLGATLPAAAVAAIVYRMARIFELRRPWRAGLAAAVVFATGLISYAVVLNPHVPAAAMVMASAACLVHLSVSPAPSRGGAWLILSGFCAALAATIDPPAVIFLILLLIVVPALRLRPALRVGGIILYLLGLVPPLLLHATLNIHLTGDLRPGSMHPELLIHRPSGVPEAADSDSFFAADDAIAGDDADEGDAQPANLWQNSWRNVARFLNTLIGPHGLLAHFPVIVLGIAGMFAVMHRHWPQTTKILAADSAIALIVILIGLVAMRSSLTAGFADRWLIVCLPILLFWAGAWVRRSHHPLIWSIAGLLLGFSVCVSLIGATDPMPRDGYTRYTALAALHNLVYPPPANPTVLADR